MEPMQSGSISIINLPSTGSLLSRTWAVYKRLSKPLISLSIGLGITFLLYLGITSLLNFFVKDSTHSAQAFMQIINSLVQFISCFAYAYFFAAMLYVIKHRNETVLSMKEALMKAKPMYRSLLWIGIISGLAIYGSAVTLVLPLLMSVWFYFAVYILVAEGLTGTEALNKSRYLTRGKWFAVLGRYLCLSAIMGVIALALIVVMAIPGAGAAVATILFAVFALTAIPFFAVYDYLRYEDLVALPRTQEFQSFNGEKRSIVFFAIVGLIFSAIVWGGSLLTCAQRTNFSNLGKGIIGVIVVSITEHAQVNMNSLNGALGHVIYNFQPDVCPAPLLPTTSSTSNESETVILTNAEIRTLIEYVKTHPTTTINP